MFRYPTFPLPPQKRENFFSVRELAVLGACVAKKLEFFLNIDPYLDLAKACFDPISWNLLFLALPYILLILLGTDTNRLFIFCHFITLSCSVLLALSTFVKYNPVSDLARATRTRGQERCHCINRHPLPSPPPRLWIHALLLSCSLTGSSF
jgi:hypothetical protein